MSDVLVVVPDDMVEAELSEELSSLDCASVPPIYVLEFSDELKGFAGYVGGPNEGELDDELDDELEDDADTEELFELEDELEELSEDTEELSPELLSAEESVCELSEEEPDDVCPEMLPGSSEPET